MNYVVAVILAWVGIFFLGRELLHKWGEREDNKKDRVKYLRRVLFDMGREEQFKQYREQHPGFSEYQALKHFLSPELLAKYESKKREATILDKESKTQENTEMHKYRVFAYDWEGFIFPLFSPYAKWDTITKEWRVPYNHRELPSGYVASCIQKYKKCSPAEADEYLLELISNHVLTKKPYMKYVTMGPTLSYYTNVIDPNDMNMTKWINIYGKSKSEEAIEEEIKDFLGIEL